MRLFLLFLTLLGAGCDSSESFDDAGEATRLVVFPGRTSPDMILLSKPWARTCVRTADRAKEVHANLSNSTEYRDGYRYVDVGTGINGYRVYFHSENVRSKRDAAFVYCVGAGSPLISNRCDVVGISERGCFELEYRATGIKPLKDVLRVASLELERGKE